VDAGAVARIVSDRLGPAPGSDILITDAWDAVFRRATVALAAGYTDALEIPEELIEEARKARAAAAMDRKAVSSWIEAAKARVLNATTCADLENLVAGIAPRRQALRARFPILAERLERLISDRWRDLAVAPARTSSGGVS
jgi:hypothetical protein